MDLYIDVVIDSLKDTAELIPFLLLTYVAIEMLEHGTSGAVERAIVRAGHAGPAVGAALGALPQCGFSAMAATLYAGGVVTVGTLVAVILSTSDELIPVFMAHGVAVVRLLFLLAFKMIVGMGVGFAVDAAYHLLHRSGDQRFLSTSLDKRHCMHVHHGHEHDEHPSWCAILRSALVHTAQVVLFIFLFSIAFGLLIEGIGQQEFALLLGRHPVRATFLAGLIGLIPNCGASVTIAELYLDGSLGAGPMIAGLLVSGGVGLLVLFRSNKRLRDTIQIAVFIYIVGVVCGLAVGASGIIF